jgi:peptidoglycan/xylan/chitin deacetylase (PgdA/CDA1 family)
VRSPNGSEERRRAVVADAALAFASSSAFRHLLTVLERLERGSERLLPVLTYHRVAERRVDRNLDPRVISTTPREFEQHVEHLAHNRRVLSLGDLLEIRRSRRPYPRRSVVITFDDAYRDFAEHAWPILRAHGLPVTLFVPTAYPDRHGAVFWWDRVYQLVERSVPDGRLETPIGTLDVSSAEARRAAISALRTWVRVGPHEPAVAALEEMAAERGLVAGPSPTLGWAELRALSSEGVAIAPHTRTHPFLDRVSIDVARDEIVGSLHDVHREIGSVRRVFSLPGGQFSTAVIDLLRAEGFEIAFTTRRGVNRFGSDDWLQLKRINVGRRTSLDVLRAQLLTLAGTRPEVRR